MRPANIFDLEAQEAAVIMMKVLMHETEMMKEVGDESWEILKLQRQVDYVNIQTVR